MCVYVCVCLCVCVGVCVYVCVCVCVCHLDDCGDGSEEEVAVVRRNGVEELRTEAQWIRQPLCLCVGVWGVCVEVWGVWKCVCVGGGGGVGCV